MRRRGSRKTEQGDGVYYGVAITKRDQDMVDAGWHKFWTSRGKPPPPVDGRSVQKNDLTKNVNGVKELDNEERHAWDDS